MIYDLVEFSARCESNADQYAPYVNYITSVIDLYAALCAGRNMQAIIAMRTKIGFTNEFIQVILDPAETGYNKRIKIAIIKLVKTLLIDY